MRRGESFSSRLSGCAVDPLREDQKFSYASRQVAVLTPSSFWLCSVFDISFAIGKRLLYGKFYLSPDRTHIHQRFIRPGGHDPALAKSHLKR